MVTLGELVMILDLHRQGLSLSAIARRTGMDRSTIAKYVKWLLHATITRHLARVGGREAQIRSESARKGRPYGIFSQRRWMHPFISELGRKLVLVGGRLGPRAVFVALEEHMPAEYAAHVASLWGLDEIDEAEIDDDDVPTISLAGPPRVGRLRTASG